jgi:hypothetical protein
LEQVLLRLTRGNALAVIQPKAVRRTGGASFPEVNMFGVRKEGNAEFTSRYAICADYSRIFQQDVNALYLLSFLLTANHASAEQCYLESFDNAVKGIPVFKEWARSWCKYSVIQNSIRLVFTESIGSVVQGTWHQSHISPLIDCVTRLAPLERFVFVMSVLEHYSDRECSLLLNCTVKDVMDARSRALQTFVGFDRVFTDTVEQSTS